MRLFWLAVLTAGCVTKVELEAALDRDGDGFLPIEAGGPDCDETRSDVNPAAVEVCGDDVDNDCDGYIDDDGVGARIWYLDADGDGHGIDLTTTACTEPEGYAPVSGDCDDTNPSIQPDAEDLCDGIDQDCDGIADDDASDLNQFRDADGDGFGVDDDVVTGCGLTPGYVLVAGDCDDNEPDVNPASEDVCDGIDQNCNGVIDEDVTFTVQFRDADGDGDGNPGDTAEACELLPGYVATSGDCDDTDPTIHSQAVDFCDGVDQDCDQVADNDVPFLLYYVDGDGDGVGAGTAALESCSPVPGYSAVTGDCDDTDPAISPQVQDTCDGVDSDCDGQIDEDALLTLYFPDLDGDGIGALDPLAAVEACIPPQGYVQLTGDCDDDDPSVNPGANDDCDGIDTDCDGTADDDVDFELLWVDGDGDGVGAGAPALLCGNPAGHAPVGGDCDDADPAVRPGLTDLCDGIDQDCDGEQDEDASFAIWFPDLDGDGAGDSSAAVSTCDGAPPGHLAVAGDCDDNDPAVVVPTWFMDEDDDGYGGPASQSACNRPVGYVARGADCDDGEPNVNPGRVEVCNNHRDDDCNTQTACRWDAFMTTTEADVVIETPYELPLGPVGDVDGDGASDLGNTFSSDFEIYLNRGGDTFDFVSPDWARVATVCEVVADQVGGTADDLLCGPYQQVGDIYFQSLEGGRPQSVVVTGADGLFSPTLHPDTPVGAMVEVRHADGARFFAVGSTTSFGTPLADYRGFDSLGVVECDGLDGACVVASTAGVTSLVPWTSGVTEATTAVPAWSIPGSILGKSISDFNGDGIDDLWLMDQSIDETTMRVVIGPFSLSSPPTVIQVFSVPAELVYTGGPVADFDADGLRDVIAIDNVVIGPGLTDSIPTLEFTYGSPEPPFFSPASDVTIYSPDYHPLFPAVRGSISDWNNDGYPDFATYEFEPGSFNRLAIFFGSGQ